METVKDFLSKFPTCPKCGADFDVKGTRVFVDGCIGIDIYNARLTTDRLHMAFYPTDPISFVDTEVRFSIDLQTYSIEFDKEKEFLDFIESGLITIDLKVGCSYCACESHIHGFEHGFGATFRLAYNGKKHDFSDTVMSTSSFSCEYNGVVYNFMNLHNINQAWIGKHNDSIIDYECTMINVPIIPLDIFNFSSINETLSKLNKILVLA